MVSDRFAESRPVLRAVLLAGTALLAGLPLAAAQQPPPPPNTKDTGEPLRIVVYGDDATLLEPGAGDDWAQRLGEVLRASDVRAEVLRAVRPGITSPEATHRLRDEVLAARPHVVVVAQSADVDYVAAMESALFSIHRAESHLVVLALDGQSAEAAGYMAFRFGEPFVPHGYEGQELAEAVAIEILGLHNRGKLATLPLTPPKLDRRAPFDLVDEGLVDVGGTLLAARGVEGGDFRLDAELVLTELDHTAAAMLIGGSYFGFDGKGETLFTNGPLFGGGVKLLDQAADFLTAGEPFQVRVERQGEALRVSVGGRLVAVARSSGPIPYFGFRPQRGELEVRSARLSAIRTLASEMPAAPGWTIPLVDLAADTDRQVVVDREEGQYLGHPTTALLDDGKTILCVYPKGHGKGAIVYKRSTDGGLTWSERLPTPESWATSQEVPTLYRTVDAAGKKRMIMFSGLYPIRMAVSEDEGQSWSELEPIGDYGGIVAMACLTAVGEPGHYLAMFHDDGRFIGDEHRPEGGGPFHLYQVNSTDGGLTWSAPRVIASHPLAHLCEPGIIRSPDGKRLAVLLRENSRMFNSFVIFSDDEGLTWTEPRQLPAALTGDRHVLRYTPDGRIFATFRDTARESPTQGDWCGWVGTWEDIVEGREGQYRVRLMDNKHRWDCAYPGLELLPDGTFVTTTYGHWTEDAQPWIASVRFKLEERLQR